MVTADGACDDDNAEDDTTTVVRLRSKSATASNAMANKKDIVEKGFAFKKCTFNGRREGRARWVGTVAADDSSISSKIK